MTPEIQSVTPSNITVEIPHDLAEFTIRGQHFSEGAYAEAIGPARVYESTRLCESVIRLKVDVYADEPRVAIGIIVVNDPTFKTPDCTSNVVGVQVNIVPADSGGNGEKPHIPF